MNQFEFDFDSTQLARSADPNTSKQAAMRVNEFGKNMCIKIYNELKKGEGTYEQIAHRCGLLPSQTCRRLPDLQKIGLAEPTEKEIKGSSGRFQRIWKAI
jgi:hypothetical protein